MSCVLAATSGRKLEHSRKSSPESREPHGWSPHATRAPRNTEPTPPKEFHRALGLFDSVMVVAGIMVGSGIFIVSAEISRQVGSAGWLLVAWVITGVLTFAGALSYGELAAMMPEAGGMYVYLREAFSPLLGFLYGWTLLTVIQTGTIAAVGIAFARFSGILFPSIREDKYLIAPIHVLPGYALSLSTAQLLAIVIIVLITVFNSYGVEWGKLIQNVFTVAKLGGMAALLVLGATVAFLHPAVLRANFAAPWHPHECDPNPRPGGDHCVRILRSALRFADGVAFLRRLLA